LSKVLYTFNILCDIVYLLRDFHSVVCAFLRWPPIYYTVVEEVLPSGPS